MASGVDLIGLYWTLAGPVEVHTGREWSLYDLKDRCELAARTGFSGIGIWHADLEHVLETRNLREIRQLVDDNGLRHMELEFLGDFFLEPGTEGRRESDRLRALLYEAAEALPVHHLKVGNLSGTEAELSQIVEAYGELCADAAQHTDATVVYEFMPYDSVVNSLDAAIAVVEGAGASNGGLAIDTWHLGKLEIQPEELRRIPPQYVSWVELADGPYGIAEEWLDEVTNRRRLPGEGEFPIRDYVRVCRELGYNEPWGVEVLSQELRALPIEEMFERAYESAMAQLVPEGERSASV